MADGESPLLASLRAAVAAAPADGHFGSTSPNCSWARAGTTRLSGTWRRPCRTTPETARRAR